MLSHMWCVEFLSAWLRVWHICVLLGKLSLLFSRAWRHLLVPPCAQTLSLFHCAFSLSSAVHWFSLRSFHHPHPTTPPLHFFVYTEFITRIFSLSFLPDSQATAVPNSLALLFFKATYKKQADHTTHSWNHTKEAQAKGKHEKENGRPLLYFTPPFCIESRQRGITAALSALEPDLSMPTVWCQSDEKAAGGYSQNDSVGWEPDLKRR